MIVFESVPLPSWPPCGVDPADLEGAVGRWATSPPIRVLAEASGWTWPKAADATELLDSLSVLSASWDFRKNKERNFIPGTPARVGDRTIPDDLVRAAADALGLVHASPLPDRGFSHLVVLGGLVGACMNRTHHAAVLRHRDLPAAKIAVLGAYRPLGGSEPERVRELGLGSMEDESQVVLAATRRAFGLGEPQFTDTPGVPAAGPNATRARYGWPDDDIEVVIAPSSQPDERRANTADQLRHWADLAAIDSEHDVLLVTTQIYVPFQHMDALRVLGLQRGCGVYSCGVDAESSLLPVREFGGRDYLQEIRSAIRAAAALLAAVRERPEGG
jgi:hypothetical protein